MKYDPVKVPLDSVGVERNTRNECINEIRSHIPEHYGIKFQKI